MASGMHATMFFLLSTRKSPSESLYNVTGLFFQPSLDISSCQPGGQPDNPQDLEIGEHDFGARR